MSKVTETVTALAAPVAEKLGLELWDVEYIREAGHVKPGRNTGGPPSNPKYYPVTDSV